MSDEIFDRIRPVIFKGSKPICTVVIDVEEDFNWLSPLSGTPYSTAHLKNISEFERIISAYGAVPTYLVTFPILEDPDAVRLLRRHAEMGRCILGIQLHTWVTPPISESDERAQSFATNLDSAMQEQKLLVLKSRFEQAFGFAPKIFRAGRYGFGDIMAGLLEKHGFLVDTSLAPRTQLGAEGGPDFTGFDYQIFWFGTERALLELPLCRSIVGWGGSFAAQLYQFLTDEKFTSRRAVSALTRSRCAERITLSPEGNDSRALRRLIRGLHRKQQSILSLSFHSSSLDAGRNPYVGSQADLHAFYDRLSSTMDYLASEMDAEFRTPIDIYNLLAAQSFGTKAPIQEALDATG